MSSVPSRSAVIDSYDAISGTGLYFNPGSSSESDLGDSSLHGGVSPSSEVFTYQFSFRTFADLTQRSKSLQSEQGSFREMSRRRGSMSERLYRSMEVPEVVVGLDSIERDRETANPQEGVCFLRVGYFVCMRMDL
ncbi:hypothetical protein ACFX2I_033422 [Malus domestica]